MNRDFTCGQEAVDIWRPPPGDYDQLAAAEQIHVRAVRTITERDTPEVARVWMQGLNPLLGGRVPALLLREGDTTEVGPKVLGAGRQFAGAG